LISIDNDTLIVRHRNDIILRIS